MLSALSTIYVMLQGTEMLHKEMPSGTARKYTYTQNHTLQTGISSLPCLLFQTPIRA